MCGVGYGLITAELGASPDIVVEDPVVAPHALAEQCGLVEAFFRVRNGERLTSCQAKRL